MSKSLPSPSTPLSPADLRSQARRLLKSLRAVPSEGSGEASRRSTRIAMQAAIRFRPLRSLAGLSLSQILARAEQIQRKHALTVLALEHGYESWVALKIAAEAGLVCSTGSESGRSAGLTTSLLMYEPGFDVLLNRWFASYEQAEDALAEQGGYLLPYRSQFLICEAEAIRLLGLDPDDPDWALIGYNWVEPKDREAWSRLRKRRIQAKRGLSIA